MRARTPGGPPVADGAIAVTGCAGQADLGAGVAPRIAEDSPPGVRGTLVAHVLSIGCPRRNRWAAGKAAAAEGVSANLRQIR